MPTTFYRAEFKSGNVYRSTATRQYAYAAKLRTGYVSFHGTRNSVPAGAAEVVGAVQVDRAEAAPVMLRIKLATDVQEYTNRAIWQAARPEGARDLSKTEARRDAAIARLAAHDAKYGELVA